MRSRLALALDSPLDPNVLRGVSEHVGVLKVGWPLTLSLGLERVRELVKSADWIEVIADLKLADIYETMEKVVERFDFVDSFIAHSFIGVEGALGPLKERLEKEDKGLYLVLSMSHRGWDDSSFPRLLEVVKRVNPKGVVVGATKPEVVRLARRELPGKVIISPGVGAQGARVGDAVCNGADVEIVGRAIYTARDPVEASRRIAEELEVRLAECQKGGSH